ncbi:MAG: type II secretion system protein M [Gammaproteobacteria bacterium]|nr:type II secretion system protein M [Gammaproteobacteria bacterium]
MNEYLAMAKEWWGNLQTRERLILIGGSVVLVVMLLWATIWDPLVHGVNNLQSGVAAKQKDLQWMQKASVQIKAVQGTQPRSGGNQSLLSLLEERVNALGLKSALQRMTPDGPNQIKFWINSGNFDQLIKLFGELEQQHGVKIVNLSVTATEQIGLVDARVTVVRGS